MKYPKTLKKGAMIGLVAPSSPVSPEQVAQCQKVLQDLGYRVKSADNLSASKGGYMAGEEEVRGNWINRMFADDEVDAIFCIRGGDGGNRIMEYVDPDIVKANPKIFVGYSDVTSLHLLFNQQCGLVTFHGPMVRSNMIEHFDKESEKAFFDALTAEKEYVYQPPKDFEIKTAKAGKACGILTGGNLTVMCTSIGTPYEMETEGKILFVEEVGEHIGNMDRNIYQLRNAGKLKGVSGILLGQFSNCDTDQENYTIVDIVKDAVKDLNIPVMYNIQSGHGFPMVTLPMGAECTMDTDNKSIVFSVER
ncbi:S66 peptidase family protein [Aminipila luticellarii]|uniref:LD-carboxypeptidase n=1 Tax=Aminipila luticellarii TaxID=2507160 RepID=A0A410PVS8_9FIRM|nr:LD-carboxypeptidase [Aminipila luticellarii]QAT42976.1 LD-carboxypeptidase [Aminipila luticellarii]